MAAKSNRKDRCPTSPSLSAAVPILSEANYWNRFLPWCRANSPSLVMLTSLARPFITKAGQVAQPRLNKSASRLRLRSGAARSLASSSQLTFSSVVRYLGAITALSAV